MVLSLVVAFCVALGTATSAHSQTTATPSGSRPLAGRPSHQLTDSTNQSEPLYSTLSREEIVTIARIEAKRAWLDDPVAWVIPLASFLIAFVAVLFTIVSWLTIRRARKTLGDVKLAEHVVAGIDKTGKELRALEKMLSGDMMDLAGRIEDVAGSLKDMSLMLREKDYDGLAKTFEEVSRSYYELERLKLAIQAQQAKDAKRIRIGLRDIANFLNVSQATNVLTNLQRLPNPMLSSEQLDERNRFIDILIREKVEEADARST